MNEKNLQTESLRLLFRICYREFDKGILRRALGLIDLWKIQRLDYVFVNTFSENTESVYVFNTAQKEGICQSDGRLIHRQHVP